jgi:hypothetical protein
MNTCVLRCIVPTVENPLRKRICVYILLHDVVTMSAKSVFRSLAETVVKTDLMSIQYQLTKQCCNSCNLSMKYLKPRQKCNPVRFGYCCGFCSPSSSLWSVSQHMEWQWPSATRMKQKLSFKSCKQRL